MVLLKDLLSQDSNFDISGYEDSYQSVLLSELAQEDPYKRPILFVARDSVNLEDLSNNLKFFSPGTKQVIIPPWDCLPYDKSGPSLLTVTQRVKGLSNLALAKSKDSVPQCFILTTVNAFTQKLIPYKELLKHLLTLQTGAVYRMDDLINHLELSGYNRVSSVEDVGEYAVRGGLLDVFNSGSLYPVRIDFFGDQVDSIRSFDIRTQKSIKNRKSVTLFPMSEVLLNTDSINEFRKKYIRYFGAAKNNDLLYENISNNQRVSGIEHWQSLFYSNMETISDYVKNALIVYDSLAEQSIDQRYSEVCDYYNARIATNIEAEGELIYNAVAPDELYMDRNYIATLVQSGHQVIKFNSFHTNDKNTIFTCDVKPVKSFIKERKSLGDNLLDAVVDYLSVERAAGKKILLSSWSEGAQSRLIDGLIENGLKHITKVDNIDEFRKLGLPNIGAGILSVETGFVDDNFILLSEQDIFGDRLLRQGKKKRKPANYIGSVNSLKVNDIVVHISHGIGRFIGLKTIEAVGVKHDCLEIHYAGEDRLFLPVENVELLSRYGGESSSVVLDKLGGIAWQARKAKLKKQLLEIAGDLIKLAAIRKQKKAPVMVAPTGPYDEFLARFPYEETEDQETAINDVCNDLASGTPMDRLICGDVGFGKTEVCMRAAFIAAMSGYQVAVIVPTTLLSRQHYKNFKDRFEGFPLVIAQASSLCSSSELRKTKEGLKNGDINIVVGTHALLGKSIEFDNLGLVIIDEEHHFGVKHKEQLKTIKNDTHVLTLSATPIPRTLQFSLVGIKELSLITTPPVDRLAVRTFVSPFDTLSVKEFLLREHFRGGQSFFVCPRISDLEKIREWIEKHVPELKTAVVHGQMPFSNIESIMDGFYGGKYNVLISTSIVESGLDIPNANTMIVYRADMFGLAALYQLRGRVGRAKRRAYALYTFSGDKILTTNAEHRLKLFQKIEGLGSGFQLASYDMDIRGAGNLLGEEQSGHIKEVGYELYQQMLEEAILELKDNSVDSEEKWSPQINISSSVLISEKYIEDIQLRLELYQRLSTLDDLVSIQSFGAELVDRFGPIPEETENLLKVIYIKSLCKKANIEKLDAIDTGIIISFKNNKFVNGPLLLKFVSNMGNSAKIRADQSIFFASECSTTIKKIRFTIKILQKIVELI